MSALEEYQNFPIFYGDPNLATKEGIWTLFNLSPYYEPAPNTTYQMIPQHEDPSTGLAQAYIIFKFEQRGDTNQNMVTGLLQYQSTAPKSLKRVYYVTGQSVNNLDQHLPGLIFPLPNLYHTLLTKFTLAVDCVSTVCDNIRLGLEIQQEAERKIDSYNNPHQNTSIAKPEIQSYSTHFDGKSATVPMFRPETDSQMALFVLNNTVKHFDLGEEFD